MLTMLMSQDDGSYDIRVVVIPTLLGVITKRHAVRGAL